MLIITAPGQGAQTPGFLAPWLELPGVAERLGAASELAGCDLIRFGTTASADEIKDTAVAQPLLVAAAIVAAAALSGGDPGDVPADVAAGHSVGELAAGVIAGVLAADDAMRLVGVRGTLQVAGAFHTRHMAPAVEALRDAAAGVTVEDPRMTLLSDADGTAVTTGKEWLERIVAQVAAPVRWDLCLRTMADLGVTAIIELPPAGTLTGLARRALPGVAQLAVKTPEQLDAARDLIGEHLADSDRHSHGHLPEWRLIVAPTSGTFRSPSGRGDAAATGAMVALTADLGTVVARGGQHAVTAPWPAEIIEWLVEDGDPVGEGQPLVRVQPREGA